MEKTFILNEPLDMHLHLRDGDMLRLVAPLTSNSFSGALVMPNFSSLLLLLKMLYYLIKKEL